MATATKPEPTVKRSVCERYDVRTGKNSEWAIIMLDERGGILQICSDFGNWSYNWPYHGRESFKHFIVELGRDTDYLTRKLAGEPDRYLPDETVRGCRDEILRQRKEREIEKAVARKAWDYLDGTDDLDTEAQLIEAVYDSPALTKVFGEEPWESISFKKDYRTGIRQFIERLWPVFVEAIRKEITDGNS